MWLRLQHPQWHKLLSQIPRPVYPPSPRITQSSHNPVRSAKATDPEPFDGNRDKAEEFVTAIQIEVTMQADAFADERMKVYICTLLHARGHGTGLGSERDHGSHKWNVPDADIGHLRFLENVEKTFGDPDRARTARAQLHDLKMTPGTTAEDYTAQFEMLVGRTSFTAVCIIQGMRLFILKKNKCLVNSISPSILHGMI